MNIKHILLLIIFIISITGCSYTELNNLSVIKTISIDYKSEFEVSVKVLNDDGNKIYKSRGKTISSAIENIKHSTNKELYLKHLSEVLIVENLALRGLDDIVEYFINNQLINKDFKLYITNKDITVHFNNFEYNNSIKFNDYLNNLNIYPYINIIPYINNNNIDRLSILVKNKKKSDIKNTELYDLLKNDKSQVYNIKCKNNLYNSYYIKKTNSINTKNINIHTNIIEKNCTLPNNYIEKKIEKDIFNMIKDYDVLGITKDYYLNTNKKKEYKSINKSIKVSVVNE